MVIILEKNIDEIKIENVIKQIEDFGFTIHKSIGDEQIILGAIGIKPNFDIRKIKIIDGVADVFRVTEPYKFVSRSNKSENTIIKVNNVEIGGNSIAVIAGPCSIENEDQIFSIAEIISSYGVKILRGGAFKPRTSPHSFQGLGEDGLKLIRNAANKFGMAVITEVIDSSQVDLVGQYADIFQVGSRNMQNFPLLKELGKQRKSVLLKRGFAATVEEWLMSAEYILAGGNEKVIMCERGIRTFETSTRNTFDVSSIPVLHKKTHLPVIADPSHAAGLNDRVAPLARAAIAAGADGIMIEVHNNPAKALSDGPQALLPKQFFELLGQMKLIAEVIGRKIL